MPATTAPLFNNMRHAQLAGNGEAAPARSCGATQSQDHIFPILRVRAWVTAGKTAYTA